jgi:prepilin-type N-terminal cleavage/methylation domain-containing protein
MIITIRSRADRSTEPPARRRHRAFTLVEVMISTAIASFVFVAVLSSFLFIGRSGWAIQSYNDLEAQARKSLEQFAQDTRQASAVSWASSTSVTLTVNGANVTYAYASGTFTRTPGLGGASSTQLLTGITSFTFNAYTITGAQITDFSDANKLLTASNSTKQIQISLSASRSGATVVSTTGTVLSARFILRNKKVTA